MAWSVMNMYQLEPSTDICNMSSIESVDCSSVCTDGYETTNLFTSDSQLRSRGFLAASFVRPPVTLIVNFKKAFDIDTVVIGIAIGEQVVSSLEVYTFCENNSKQPSRGNNFNRWRKLAEFVANPSFYPRRLVFSKLELQQEHCRVHANLLTGVKRLCFKIKSMKDGGTPCLSSLNIISHECEFWTKNKNVEHKSLLPSDNHFQSESISCADSVNVQCPEEFEDAITHELMSKPFLLPSGFNIDESSLVKIMQLAESQGRIPYDPFSYQEFSLSSRPTENLSLLDRIRSYNRNTRVSKSKVIQKFS